MQEYPLPDLGSMGDLFETEDRILDEMLEMLDCTEDQLQSTKISSDLPRRTDINLEKRTDINMRVNCIVNSYPPSSQPCRCLDFANLKINDIKILRIIF